jgi:hypothetical protein
MSSTYSDDYLLNYWCMTADERSAAAGHVFMTRRELLTARVRTGMVNGIHSHNVEVALLCCTHRKAMGQWVDSLAAPVRVSAVRLRTVDVWMHSPIRRVLPVLVPFCGQAS